MAIFNSRILKFAKIICWIIFCIQFSFLIGFHGVKTIDMSKYALILDIVILIILQSIALFITLSEIHKSYVFFKNAFFFSILNVLTLLFSMFYFEFNKPSNINSILNILIFSLKLIEICPLIILICLCSKIKKSPGNIDKLLDSIKNNDNSE